MRMTVEWLGAVFSRAVHSKPCQFLLLKGITNLAAAMQPRDVQRFAAAHSTPNQEKIDMKSTNGFGVTAIIPIEAAAELEVELKRAARRYCWKELEPVEFSSKLTLSDPAGGAVVEFTFDNLDKATSFFRRACEVLENSTGSCSAAGTVYLVTDVPINFD